MYEFQVAGGGARHQAAAAAAGRVAGAQVQNHTEADLQMRGIVVGGTCMLITVSAAHNKHSQGYSSFTVTVYPFPTTMHTGTHAPSTHTLDLR